MARVAGKRDLLARLAALEATVAGERGWDGECDHAAAVDLVALGAAELATAKDVLRLHEAAVFLFAYPPGPRTREAAGALLAAFEGRADLAAHADALENTGIAGTRVRFPFFAAQAAWLARRHGGALTIDWDAWEEAERVAPWLERIALETEVPALYDLALSPRRWIERMRGPEETDAAFLVSAFESLEASPAVRRTALEALDVPFVLELGARSFSRTRDFVPARRVSYAPPRRGRPDLARAVRVPPRAVRRVPLAEGRRLVELARRAMAVRARDLDSFAYADPADVRLIDCGDGLEIAWMGLELEQRIVLEALHAGLMLRDGVPIGYVLASALYGSSDVSYNVFETFRGGEAAHVYGRVLAAVHHLYGCDTFAVTPYQLGHGNPEGLDSGAWWFYRKLGFRPLDPEARRLERAELAAVRRDRMYRTPKRTLRRLVRHPVFFFLGKPREDVILRLSLPRIALAATDVLARELGSARRARIRALAERAARRLGLGRAWRRWPARERFVLERWSPLLVALPGLERWPAADRRALASVLRAKAARPEDRYVRLFDRHRRLRRALLEVAARAPTH